MGNVNSAQHLLKSPANQATRFSSTNQPKNRRPKESVYYTAYRRIMKQKVKVKTKIVTPDGQVVSEKEVLITKFEAIIQKVYEMAISGAGNVKAAKLLMDYSAGQREAQMLIQNNLINDTSDNTAMDIFTNIIAAPSELDAGYIPYDEMDRKPE